MSMKTIVVLAATLAMATIGCNDKVETITYENEGEICVNANPMMGETGDVVAGASATINVQMHGCLSSSCDRLLYAECTVELVDGVLIVESSGALEDLRGKSRACTDDCGFMIAQCDTPLLDEGEYTIRHGEEEFTLSVPAESVECPL